MAGASDLPSFPLRRTPEYSSTTQVRYNASQYLSTCCLMVEHRILSLCQSRRPVASHPDREKLVEGNLLEEVESGNSTSVPGK